MTSVGTAFKVLSVEVFVALFETDLKPCTDISRKKKGLKWGISPVPFGMMRLCCI